MATKAILFETKKATFTPEEGKEFTKHEYLVKRYVDEEYVKDVQNNDYSDEELEENEYNYFDELYIDGKLILTTHNHYDAFNVLENGEDIMFSNKFKPISRCISSHGLFGNRHLYPFDELKLDRNTGKWNEESKKFDTEKDDTFPKEDLKVFEYNIPDEDIIYYKDNRLTGFSIWVTFGYNTSVSISLKGENNNILFDKYWIAIANDGKITSDLTELNNVLDELNGSISILLRYTKLIKSKVLSASTLYPNTLDKYRQVFYDRHKDVKLKEILDSVYEENKVNTVSSNEKISYETEMLEKYKNEKSSTMYGCITNSLFRQYMKQETEKLPEKYKNFMFYAGLIDNETGDVNLFNGKMINYHTNEEYNVLNFIYQNDSILDDNRGYLCNRRRVLFTDDGRMFMEVEDLNNNLELLFTSLSTESILELINKLGLVCLLDEKVYGKNMLKNIETLRSNICFNTYIELTSNEKRNSKMLRMLIKDMNISIEDSKEYVNELKRIVEEISKNILK